MINDWFNFISYFCTFLVLDNLAVFLKKKSTAYRAQFRLDFNVLCEFRI